MTSSSRAVYAPSMYVEMYRVGSLLSLSKDPKPRSRPIASVDVLRQSLHLSLSKVTRSHSIKLRETLYKNVIQLAFAYASAFVQYFLSHNFALCRDGSGCLCSHPAVCRFHEIESQTGVGYSKVVLCLGTT